jgi:hypothetical protein
MIRKLLLIPATVVALAVGFAAPAMAHDVSNTVWAGAPPALVALGHGGVELNHTRVWALDVLADGRGVHTYYWTSPDTGRQSVGDANGSAGGRGETTVSGRTIVSYQVCAGNAPNEICSGQLGT